MHFRITGQRCRKKIILFNSVIIRGEKIISGQHERDGFERFEGREFGAGGGVLSRSVIPAKAGIRHPRQHPKDA